MPVTLNATTTNGLVTSADNSGELQLQTNNGTTAVTIDTSQNVSLAKNLTFTGTGNRITGDYSDATAANRVAFQTSTTNGNTGIYFIPNGTATTAGITASNSSTPNNSSLAQFQITSTDLRITSTTIGTGTLLPLTMYTGGSERLRIDTSGNLLFNSGYGSVATAYGCRAWVNFNGTGTVAIRASGNVTSITDNGIGDYTVNFTNAMPDANYAGNVFSNFAGGASAIPVAHQSNLSRTTAGFRFQISDANSYATTRDQSEIYVSFFR